MLYVSSFGTTFLEDNGFEQSYKSHTVPAGAVGDACFVLFLVQRKGLFYTAEISAENTSVLMEV